jgi:transaldolase
LLDTEARRTAYDAAGTERRVFRGEQLTNKPKTKLLVDGGDPKETLRIKNLLGFVDGQTTNPSLIAKNPEIQRRLVSGQRLSEQEEKEAYKKIVQSISPHVGDAGVSIEVFADLDSREVVQGGAAEAASVRP